MEQVGEGLYWSYLKNETECGNMLIVEVYTKGGYVKDRSLRIRILWDEKSLNYAYDDSGIDSFVLVSKIEKPDLKSIRLPNTNQLNLFD